MNSNVSNTTSWLPGVPRSAWLCALVLGLAFFASEHSLTASLADAFTQNAEEMLATAEGGNTLRRLAYLSIAALGGVLAWTTRRKPGQAAIEFELSLPALLIAAMIALTFASVLWAEDRGQCVRRLLVLALALAGVFGLARRFDLKELCVIALAVASACVVVGIGCEVVLGTFRPWSGDYRFSGTVHPNTQGAYLATVCFAALCLSFADAPRRKTYWSILVAGVVLLVLTKSRTSTAGVLVALGVTTLVMSSARMRLAVPALGAWLLAMGAILALLGGSYVDRVLAKVAFLGRQEDTESFSGRTTIWPVVEQYIARKPWLGYGYESFWTPEAIEEVTEECQWAVREAHSAYLDMLLSLGWAGLALYCVMALSGMLAALLAYHRGHDACALFSFGMVLNGFFNGLFESGMVWVSFPTFMIAAGVVRLACFPSRVMTAEPAWESRSVPSQAPRWGVQL